MAPIVYKRKDTVIAVRRDGESMVITVAKQSLTVDPKADVLALFSAWTPTARLRAGGKASGRTLNRVLLRIEEAQWQALEWEKAFADSNAWWKRPLVVRDSAVPARVRQYPYLAPVQVLEIGTPRRARAAVEGVLRGPHAAAVMMVQETELTSMIGAVAAKEWPAVHVLHFHGLGALPSRLFDPDAETIGSVGWILRLIMRWSTRLVVLEDDPTFLPPLRQLAHRIVQAGGPAVMVADTARADPYRLYAELVHDRPLDYIQKQLDGVALFGGTGREELLRFSGMAEQVAHDAPPPSRRRRRPRMIDLGKTARPASINVDLLYDAIISAAKAMDISVQTEGVRLGREDPPRRIRFGEAIAGDLFSKGVVVRPIDDQIVSVRGKNDYVSLNDLRSIIEPRCIPLDDVLDPNIEPSVEVLIRERAVNLHKATSRFQFEDRERDGTIPTVVKIDNLRSLARAAGSPRPSPEPRGPRHVIATFHRLDERGTLIEIPQKRARLHRGKEVVLGVRIGHNDEMLFTLGDTLFHDEKIEWKPDAFGCWIEIAVTPLDFDIADDARVQEAWLPREGDMPTVAFPVTPLEKTEIPGVARLRFTIFSNNNVVQSFLVAALLEGTASATPLGTALGIDRKRVEKDVGYLSRLEYDAMHPEAADSAPKRALSIVANELPAADDKPRRKVFSIKGKGFFSTNVNDNLPNYVKNAREAIKGAALNRFQQYRFGAANSGENFELVDLLFDAAVEGWRLYNQIVPDSEDRAAVAQRLGSEGVIHAAHMNLDKVVPWSLIYDCQVDPSLDEYYGENTITPVQRAVCPAGLPLPDGSFNKEPCGQRSDCKINGADADGFKKVGAAYVSSKTVICPRHFWGFAHQIEVPAQQKAEGKETEQIQPVIEAGDKATVFIGHNPNTKPAEVVNAHLTKLRGLAPKIVVKEPVKPKRNAILQALQKADPDIVYFFCHAWKSTKQQPDKHCPNLDFGDREIADIAAAGDFANTKFTHHPLVFINGCGSAAFSDSAPAELITQFIQDAKAAAVIGTEVTVWSELAVEVGLTFLSEFLANTPAGLALLRTRRRLLQRKNPLGLIYTLYGSAGLELKIKST